MIKTVLFVHGTGVRKDAYYQTSARIVTELDAMKLGFALRSCCWGDLHGARLGLQGVSIPDYTGEAKPPGPKEQQRLALWQLLAHDPLFELRDRAASAASAFVPPAEKQRKANYVDMLRKLAKQPEVVALIGARALPGQWQQAVDAVADSAALRDALAAAPALDADLRITAASAVVASLQQQLADANMVQLGQPLRDALVALCVDCSGGHALGAKDWLKDRLIGFGLRWATDKAKRERDALYNVAYPAAGDILLYQARGESIRNFIVQQIGKCDGEVAVLAHSLGGIACVDMLVERALPQVKLLVTVGSQASFLYEIGALCKLPFGQPLPVHFPARWLNFYDPNDLLSYRAAPIFRPHAVDEKIVSEQPFPLSHSAYWDMPPLWQRLKQALSE